MKNKTTETTIPKSLLNSEASCLTKRKYDVHAGHWKSAYSIKVTLAFSSPLTKSSLETVGRFVIGSGVDGESELLTAATRP